MVRAYLSLLFSLILVMPAVADGTADVDAGVARLEARDPSTAIELFTRAIQSKDLSQDSLALTYHRRGLAFYMQGEAGRAILDYTIALWHEDLPREFRPRTLNNRGLAFEALNHYDTALRDYGLSIRLNPNYAEAYANRGNLRRKFNQNAEAISDYNMALRSGHPHPQFVFAWQGVSFESLGQRKEAADAFRRALQIDPKFELAKSHLAKLEDAKSLTQAFGRKRLPRGEGGPLVVTGTPGIKGPSEAVSSDPWNPPAPSTPKIVSVPASQSPETEEAKPPSGAPEFGLRPAISEAPRTKEVEPKASVNETAITQPSKVDAPKEVPAESKGGEGGSDQEYVLQLGSFVTQNLAEDGWKKASKAAKQVLEGLVHSIVKVEVPEKGVMYRLYAGSLPEKEAALRLCRTLREKGSACIVIRR